MGITTNGLSICAAALTGSYTTNHYIAVGTSGLAFNSGNTVLGSEFDRNQIDTNDLTVDGQVTFIANWSPIDISGCILREDAIFTEGSVMLCRNILAGSMVFDGEQELQIQETIRFVI